MAIITVATVTIQGLSPMTHSHQHSEPKLEGESFDASDKRTWRSKLNVEDGHIVIPAFGMHMSLVSAAKYTKRKIVGQGNATWTAKFSAGVMLMAAPRLDTPLDAVIQIPLSVHTDGVRGSGKRVIKNFPQIPPGWKSTFEVTILDPIITLEIFREMLDTAGIFVGLGQFRPENTGNNGRFKVLDIKWLDNRQLVS